MNKEEVLDEINVLYERISNPEDCENGCYSFSDGNYTEALEILIDYYEVGLIEELEKVKKEILEENRFIWYPVDIKDCIDKHIAELKRENNTDCRNCDKWKTCENGEKGHANGTTIGYSIGECRDYVELKGEAK